MTPNLILIILVSYFLVLIGISFWTTRESKEDSFHTGDKASPWYVVAFGMIGASLSGVTFISLPGWVASQEFAYMQMVFGYLIGYIVISFVLLPIYYKANLTSIYTFLEQRFGVVAHKTGSGFFLLSRVLGASFRLYLVAIVLQKFLFASFGISFWQTTLISILLIWIYTFKGGIKTVVWTDTLQTLFMLSSLGITLYLLMQHLNLDISGVVTELDKNNYSQIFFWENINTKHHFLKHFIGGVFITIAMTGLDQDMMQKNLTCKNLKEAQKNMMWFSGVLIIVNFLFLTLGGLLFIYATKNNISIPAKTDHLFPTVALQGLPEKFAGIIFLLGLIAAAYSSADSALTSLTTSFCLDFLPKESNENIKTRYFVHIGFSILLFIVIQLANAFSEQNVIGMLFKASTYTYGPLLGLFAFGIFTKREVKDNIMTLCVCLASPMVCYLLDLNSVEWLNGYQFGYEILALNGLITFWGLYSISTNQNNDLMQSIKQL
ncbi:MAG: sodium:solute symporter [Cytophagales bacterium]|nr:sodium:solute symporter [Cytophagales bacterium]